MQGFEEGARYLVSHYGYHAVPMALFVDATGIPWAWIFLLLLAGEAKLNVLLMMLYGFAVLMLFDHILYWMSAKGGQKLVRKICAKKPDWAPAFESTRDNIHRRGALAVIFGRYLPYAGRLIGFGAGLSAMPYLKFSIYDAIGVGISVFGFGLVAHFVGIKTIQSPHFYPVVMGCMVAVVVLTVAGAGFAWWKKRRDDAKSEGGPNAADATQKL